jgi:hypothetical protein
VRRLRHLIEAAIAIAGAAIVFLALVLITDDHPQLRVGIVLLGVLMIEAGVWNLPNYILPSERKYLDLREKVDEFILLVRALNREVLEARAAGTGGSSGKVQDILDAMHASVEQMGELAGRTGEEGPVVVPSPDER